MYCKKCNTEIANNMKFCPYCGTSTQETDIRKCEVCGYSWLTGEDLCPNCGHNSQSKETFSVHDLMDKLCACHCRTCSCRNSVII